MSAEGRDYVVTSKIPLKLPAFMNFLDKQTLRASKHQKKQAILRSNAKEKVTVPHNIKQL